MATKTATTYNVMDFCAKQLVSRAKDNTLTMTGIARSLDNGHIFIFDGADKRLYEFSSEDIPFKTANALNDYPCEAAYFGKALVKGDSLFYLGTSTATGTGNANPTGATVYLYRYNFKTQSDPEYIDSLAAASVGATQFTTGAPCLFVDDALVYFQASSSTYICPVLRMAAGTPRIGFIGGASQTTQAIQRISPNKQILVAGSVTSNSNYPISRVPAMALSQLLLPEPIVKTANQRLSVSYTISIQD